MPTAPRDQVTVSVNREAKEKLLERMLESLTEIKELWERLRENEEFISKR